MAMMVLMTYSQIVLTVGACIFTLSVGLISIVWPEKVQRYALKRCTGFYFWPNPILGWMKTSGYIAYVRLMGIVFVGFGLFVLLLVIGKK
jgi:hypothetical protein